MDDVIDKLDEEENVDYGLLSGREDCYECDFGDETGAIVMVVVMKSVHVVMVVVR